MIVDSRVSIQQVLRMVCEQKVRSVQGDDITVHAGTLCIHGDQPGAVEFAKDIRAALQAENIDVKAVARKEYGVQVSVFPEPRRARWAAVRLYTEDGRASCRERGWQNG